MKLCECGHADVGHRAGRYGTACDICIVRRPDKPCGQFVPLGTSPSSPLSLRERALMLANETRALIDARDVPLPECRRSLLRVIPTQDDVRFIMMGLERNR